MEQELELADRVHVEALLDRMAARPHAEIEARTTLIGVPCSPTPWGCSSTSARRS